MSTIIDTPNKLPSVDRLVNDSSLTPMIKEFGYCLVTNIARKVLNDFRCEVLGGNSFESSELTQRVREEITRLIEPSLRRVINLTGTVLHTNLGRAGLPEVAIQAMNDVARGASNLEFNLDSGKRGDRHQHPERLLCELTGAESAMVVNNNAAAVLVTLNSLALRREVPVSRGELIEIGGAFRMPDIMSRAGCKLVEVGTTNRTHPSDFEAAITTRTALLMKVHTSNYEIFGFTKSVSEAEFAKIAEQFGIPFLTDLGSGTLINLEDYGLPHEPTVNDALQYGADLVTFSGDKLLGGPQSGIIVGRKELIDKIKKNPISRAIRPDKITLAALQAVLSLYANPVRLQTELPALRWLSRDPVEINKIACRIAPVLQKQCTDFAVEVTRTTSQVGSGALPTAKLESFGLAITQCGKRKRSGRFLKLLAKAFRELPIPVIGRITDDELIFDLRCLENESEFIQNFECLVMP